MAEWHELLNLLHKRFKLDAKHKEEFSKSYKKKIEKWHKDIDELFKPKTEETKNG